MRSAGDDGVSDGQDVMPSKRLLLGKCISCLGLNAVICGQGSFSFGRLQDSGSEGFRDLPRVLAIFVSYLSLFMFSFELRNHPVNPRAELGSGPRFLAFWSVLFLVLHPCLLLERNALIECHVPSLRLAGRQLTGPGRQPA